MIKLAQFLASSVVDIQIYLSYLNFLISVSNTANAHALDVETHKINMIYLLNVLCVIMIIANECVYGLRM